VPFRLPLVLVTPFPDRPVVGDGLPEAREDHRRSRSGLAQLSLPPPPPPGPDSEIALIRQVTGLLSPQAPDELVRTALLVCGDCDMTSQFHIGVDLMIRGLDAYLATLPADAPAPG